MEYVFMDVVSCAYSSRPNFNFKIIFARSFKMFEGDDRKTITE